MLPPRPRLAKPGLFVTATDTGVGKTVVTCAIAWTLRQAGKKVGVCKPFGSGCRSTGPQGTLLHPDAVALARWAGYDQPPELVNPIRYAAPLAPAVAAEQDRRPPDYTALAQSLEAIAAASDVLLLEGIGGLLVPLDSQHTVLDLATWLGYPVLVVTRAALGTLNHTAMTVTLLRRRACRVAGLVVNAGPAAPQAQPDPSTATNPTWLQRMNRAPLLAHLPRCEPPVDPEHGSIPQPILDAIGRVHWGEICGLPATAGSGA